MPTVNQPRNTFLDFLKGILILLVTYGHAIQFAGYRDEGFWQDPVYQAIYMFHMPLFMAVSGYVAYSGIQRRGFGEVVGTRFRQLIVPIIAWGVLAQGIKLAISPAPDLAAFPRHAAGYIAYSLWFLWALFGAVLLAAALRRFGKDTPLIAALCVLAVLLVPRLGNFYLFQYTLPFFWLGYFAARRAAFPGWMRSPVFLGVMLVLSGLCYTFWRLETYAYLGPSRLALENLRDLSLRYVAGVVASAAAVALLWRLYRVWSPGWVLMLGKNSLAIYILQELVYLTFQQDGDHPWRNKFIFTLVAAPPLALLFCLAAAGIGRIGNRLPLIAPLFFGKIRQGAPKLAQPKEGEGA